MTDKLVIIGAGGHGQALADLAESLSEWSEIVFVDDCYPSKTEALGFQIVGKVADIFQTSLKRNSFIVAIGHNDVRMELIKEIKLRGLNLVSLIHNKSFVSKYAKIGVGVVVMAGAVISTNVKLADGCLINSNATVDHNCNLEPGAHLGVGVQLAGGVFIGAKAWLQSGVSAGYHTNVKEGDIVSTGTCL